MQSEISKKKIICFKVINVPARARPSEVQFEKSDLPACARPACRSVPRRRKLAAALPEQSWLLPYPPDLARSASRSGRSDSAGNHDEMSLAIYDLNVTTGKLSSQWPGLRVRLDPDRPTNTSAMTSLSTPLRSAPRPAAPESESAPYSG